MADGLSSGTCCGEQKLGSLSFSFFKFLTLSTTVDDEDEDAVFIERTGCAAQNAALMVRYTGHDGFRPTRNVHPVISLHRQTLVGKASPMCQLLLLDQLAYHKN